MGTEGTNVIESMFRRPGRNRLEMQEQVIIKKYKLKKPLQWQN